MPFVKIDCGILDSTLWVDRDAREVFLTALLMAEPVEFQAPIPQLALDSLNETGWYIPPGWYGLVNAAAIGIIRRAGIDSDRGVGALNRLSEPELLSRSPQFDGRRLVRIDGGFVVLNYFKYRDRDYTSAERSRRYRERLSSRRDAVASRRDITQAEVEEEVDTEVRTVLGDPVRTGSNTVVSREQNSHDDNGFDRRAGERRHGNGANPPNALPRDHAKHRICGGPLSKLCFSYNQFDTLAGRYHGNTPEETEAALIKFHEYVLAKIPDDKLPGDMVWLLKHFDAWLVEIGRVAPTPVRTRKRNQQTTSDEELAQIEREVKEQQKRNGARR